MLWQATRHLSAEVLSEEGVDVEVTRRIARYPELAQRTLTDEAGALQECDGWRVRGHDEGVNSIESGRREGPVQHRVNGATNVAAAPVRRCQVVDKLGVRVGKRPVQEAAGANE